MHSELNVFDDVGQIKAMIACSRFEEARVLFDAHARTVNGSSPALLSIRAALALAEGKTDEAAEILGRLSEAGQIDADGLANLANCHRVKLRHAEALSCIDAALALQPDDVRFLVVKVELLIELDDLASARAVAAKLPDEEAATFMLRGSIAHGEGDLWQANRCFRQAAAIDAKNADIWVNIASVEAGLGRAVAAAAAAAEAYRRAPASVDVMVTYGWRLIDCGDVVAAEQVLKRAAALAPKSIAVHEALATARVLAGENEAAIADLTQIVRAQPKDVQALVALGRVLRLSGRLDHALGLAEEARKLAADATLVRSFRADCLLAKANFATLWGPGDQSEDLAGRIIVVPSSMPIPEIVLALRFARATAIGDDVTVLAPPFLRPLLTQIRDVRVTCVDEAASDKVEHLGHLPSRLHARAVTKPYLAPDPARAEVWRTAFANLGAPAIGIVWRPRDRSLGQEVLVDAVRAAFPDARLLNLTVQVAGTDTARAAVDDGLLDAAPHLTDHEELLAAVAGLDLLIGVDSLAAHLAGATGTRGLVLVRPGRHWAWVETNGVSLWYPSLRVAEIPHGFAPKSVRAALSDFAAACPPLDSLRAA